MSQDKHNDNTKVNNINDDIVIVDISDTKSSLENFVNEAINFVGDLTSKIKNPFGKESDLIPLNMYGFMEDGIEAKNVQINNSINNIFSENQSSYIEIEEFLLNIKLDGLSIEQCHKLDEQLRKRINQVLQGTNQEICELLDFNHIHIFHSLKSHYFYDLMPVITRAYLSQALINKIKSLFFEDLGDGISLKDLIESKHSIFKQFSIDDDRLALEFLSDLSKTNFFKKKKGPFSHSAKEEIKIDPTTKEDIKILVNKKMDLLLWSLGGTSSEKRLSFFTLYTQWINQINIFTPEEKKKWLQRWEAVKEDAEHYAQMSTQQFDLPKYGDSMQDEIERLGKTIERDKEFYVAAEDSTLKKAYADKIYKTISEVSITLDMTECGVVWWVDHPQLENIPYPFAYIRYLNMLYFYNREDEVKMREIKFNSEMIQNFDQTIKGQLENGVVRVLSKTELHLIQIITNHKDVPEEKIERQLHRKDVVVGCDLLKVAELPVFSEDIEKFWKDILFVSGKAYVRIKDKLYYMEKASQFWKEIEISPENLIEFDNMMNKSGAMLLQSELALVRTLTNIDNDGFIENFGVKETYYVTTEKCLLEIKPCENALIKKTYFEIVEHYIVDGNAPDGIKKRIIKEDTKKINEVIIEVERKDAKDILQILPIYSKLLSDHQIYLSDNETQTYQPDLYLAHLLLKGMLNLLSLHYPGLEEINILNINNLGKLSLFVAQLAKMEPLYLKYFIQGLLIFAAKQNEFFSILAIIEATRLIGPDAVEVINKVVEELCYIEAECGLLVPSCALAYRILSGYKLDAILLLPNFLDIVFYMEKNLASNLFSRCVQILESKQNFIKNLDQIGEHAIEAWNNLRYRSMFAETVHANKIYTVKNLQSENKFITALFAKFPKKAITKQGYFSEDAFTVFKNLISLDYVDLVYIKTQNLLSPEQIKNFFNAIGISLANNNPLTEMQIRMIALYLDQEEIIKVFFSDSAHKQAEAEGEINIYLLNYIRNDFKKIIEIAKKLSQWMTPEAKQEYCYAFITEKTQAYKILRYLKEWRSEKVCFENILAKITHLQSDYTWLLYYRYNDRLLLDPGQEKLPTYLYAAIRQGVETGALSLESIVELIEEIFLLGHGNREHAWGLFIAICDKVRKFSLERFEALFQEMIEDNQDKGLTFIFEVKQLLAINFSNEQALARGCIEYITDEFLNETLDRITDDKPTGRIRKTESAQKFYENILINFQAILSFAKNILTRPFEELPILIDSKKDDSEPLLDNNIKIIIDLPEDHGNINLSFYAKLEQGDGKFSFEVLKDLFKSFGPNAGFYWNVKKNDQKLIAPLLDVYFQKKQEAANLTENNPASEEATKLLDQIIERVENFTDHFLNINAQGQSVLMLAVLKKDVELFDRVLNLFNEVELAKLFSARDKAHKNIFHYLIEEKNQENISFIMNKDFLCWETYKKCFLPENFLNFNEQGQSLLMIAILNQDRPLFDKIVQTFNDEFLIEILNAKDKEGKNLLHYFESPFEGPIWLTEREISVLNVDLFINFDEMERSLLMLAIVNGNEENFNNIVHIFEGENLNKILHAKDKEGKNILVYLIEYGCIDLLPIELFTKNFADHIFEDCGNGFTPLHYAILRVLQEGKVDHYRNILKELLNEFIPGENYQHWKNIFKILETNTKLKPLYEIILQFAHDEDKEIFKQINQIQLHAQDPLRVMLGKPPKLTNEEKQFRDQLPLSLDKNARTDITLKVREIQGQDSYSAVVTSWWKQGFFGSGKANENPQPNEMIVIEKKI